MNNQLVFFDIQDRYEALSRFGDTVHDFAKVYRGGPKKLDNELSYIL